MMKIASPGGHQPSQTCPGGPIYTSLFVAIFLQLGSIIESNFNHQRGTHTPQDIYYRFLPKVEGLARVHSFIQDKEM